MLFTRMRVREVASCLNTWDHFRIAIFYLSNIYLANVKSSYVNVRFTTKCRIHGDLLHNYDGLQKQGTCENKTIEADRIGQYILKQNSKQDCELKCSLLALPVHSEDPRQERRRVTNNSFSIKLHQKGSVFLQFPNLSEV